MALYINIRKIEKAGYRIYDSGVVNGKSGRPLKPRLVGDGYHQVSTSIGGKVSQILLHRLVATKFLGLTKNKYVDHIDNNPLNNHVSNLRVCTQSQNIANKIPIVGKSKYRGVSVYKDIFVAYIKVNGKSRQLVRTNNEVEAAIAYDTAAKEEFGEFATLNFI